MQQPQLAVDEQRRRTVFLQQEVAAACDTNVFLRAARNRRVVFLAIERILLLAHALEGIIGDRAFHDFSRAVHLEELQEFQ